MPTIFRILPRSRRHFNYLMALANLWSRMGFWKASKIHRRQEVPRPLSFCHNIHNNFDDILALRPSPDARSPASVFQVSNFPADLAGLVE